jgi:tetratricopeptide (TPR) repeat protein
VLHTFGGLRLDDQPFRRPKPLLLLAYLALEGSQTRRAVAELFWSEAADPLNSLSVALAKLRKLEVIQSDESKVWTDTLSDVAVFSRLYADQKHTEASQVYTGEFAQGVDVEELGADLEEWLRVKRGQFTNMARASLLALAEAAATTENYTQASQYAERGFGLQPTDSLEIAEQRRFYQLFVACQNPLQEQFKSADGVFPLSLESAQVVFKQRFLGRQHELATLGNLRLGESAWLQGGQGIGKTKLLLELEHRTGWRYLPARSGLPLSGLQPILHNLDVGIHGAVLQLAKLEGGFIVDDWQDMDNESQNAIQKTLLQRPNLRWVIASNQPPPFRTDIHLVLGNLLESDLSELSGAYVATKGIPNLVAAWQRKEPLETVLQKRFLSLLEPAQDVFLALCLLEQPDLDLLRQTLPIDAHTLRQALDSLVQHGMVGTDLIPHNKDAAIGLVNSQKAKSAQIALALARKLKTQQAYVLFQFAQGFWTEADEAKILKTHLDWAAQLLQQNAGQKVLEVLKNCPERLEVVVVRGTALEQVGQYKEALELLAGWEDPEIEALLGKLYWRIGQLEKAQLHSQNAAASQHSRARGSGMFMVGILAHHQKKHQEARGIFAKCVTIWRGLNNRKMLVQALNLLGIQHQILQKPRLHLFEEALALSENDPQMAASICINLGRIALDGQHFETATDYFTRAIGLATQAEAEQNVLVAYMNLGVVYHLQGQYDQAYSAYKTSLQLSEKLGSLENIGLNMANLAELEGDFDAWEEAVNFLELHGFTNTAQVVHSEMTAFRGRSEQVIYAALAS